MLAYLFMFLLLFTAGFLILLVLIQRGKGGGLAGAFGGLGGQSAFGTKAGDTFTKITIGVAAFWIILCAASVRMLATTKSRVDVGGGNTAVEEGAEGQTSGDDADSPGASGSSGGGTTIPSSTGD